MKTFFEYLKERINTQVPEIKTVRMWNSQLLHSNESYERESDKKKTTSRSGYRNEKAFPYPACFVEFMVNGVDNRCMGIKDYLMVVRFRFGLESYKFERLETFDFADNFDASMQLCAPTEISGLTFTTLQEVSREWDEDHNNVEAPYIDYFTRYRSSVAYQRRSDITKTGIIPKVNAFFLS